MLLAHAAASDIEDQLPTFFFEHETSLIPKFKHKVTRKSTTLVARQIRRIDVAINKIDCLMLKIEHIGIAVKDLEESIPLFEQLLNTPCYKTEAVEDEGVQTAFFRTGDSKIELLEATTSSSPIARFLEKKGAGIHHIAFEVADIEAEMKRLSALGFELLHEVPKNGADNKRICFLHPKSTNGVLVELCQERED